MFKNYLLIALRNLKRNRIYSLINICGLAIGLAVFIFAAILTQYEKSHDIFFENAARIYTLGSVLSPQANYSVKEFDGVYTAIAPLLEAEATDIEATARIVQDEYLLTLGERGFYQKIKFADKALLKIFDFEYLAGDTSALDDPLGIALTETIAKKYFPAGNAMGKVISLNFHSKIDLRVTAVIRDIPRNSHFISSLIKDNPLEVIASLNALKQMDEFKLEGNWDNITTGDLTYVLLPSHLDGQWLEQQANDVFQRHASDDVKKFISGVKSRRLQDMNLVLWDAVGLPIITVVMGLGLMVLIIAGLNYTNLATAQAMDRAKEVGLRKTLGAKIGQLLIQFLVESVMITFIALLVALAMLEIIIPVFNDRFGKILSLDYFSLLPPLVIITFLIGLIAGAYPAYVITRVKPVDALKESLSKGLKRSLVRSAMIGAQFVFSVFLLAMVAVVTIQNEKIMKSSEIFPKSQIVTLQKTWVGDIPTRHDTLKREITALSGVENMTFSSQVPFIQQNWTFDASKNSGDIAGKVNLNRIMVEYDFLKTYDIPLIAGRDFSQEFANDMEKKESTVLNVIINETALKKLGFKSLHDALNKSFYQIFRDNEDGKKSRAYVIVGVMKDQNFLGLHNSIKPIVLRVHSQYYETASIRIKGKEFSATMREIERIWKKINPDYPIQVEYLDDIFNHMFKIYKSINIALAGFTVMALTLAFIGLFGLAAFMAAGRTKEIGIRKVMGAKTHQIVTLLIWQFSLPVLLALQVALPLSYFASDAYLNFFADRIESPIVMITGSGLVAVILSWLIVLTHAIRVSSRKPIHALRYE